MYVFFKCLSIVIFLALLFSGKLLSLCNEKIQNSILGKQSFTAVLRAVLCFADIGLIFYIGSQKTIDAFVLLASMLVFAAIWSILCVVGIVDEQKVSAPKLDSSILKNAKKALTNGAGILSVISCYTTANGMKDVVFGGWLAYPASIAVQVTLAFLSFFLLRFIFAVKELQWPSLAKRITSCLLVLITTGYLTMSSLFSYSFIVTKAYEKTRTENNEAIARTYFTETANLLESENRRRGTALYSAMKAAINDPNGLSAAVQLQQDTDTIQKNSDLLLFLTDVRNITDKITFETMTDFVDVTNLSSGDQRNMDTLLDNNAILQGKADDLDDVLSKLDLILNKDSQTWSKVDYIVIRDCYIDLYGKVSSNAEGTLNEVFNTIEGLSVKNQALKDHILKTETSWNRLRDKFRKLESKLENAYAYIEQNNMAMMQTSQSNSSAATIQSADAILRRINEIKIKAESSGTQNDAKKEVETLLTEINNWASAQGLPSEVLESVQNFCENLKEYRKYIELEQGLEQFNNEAVGTIYVVISDEDEEKSVGNVSYVKEDKWIAARNDAFYALESGVSLLPNEPVGTEAEESTVDNKITEIPSEAIRLQKLLFAELTDVERAINYFEKEYTGYREMAVFSVVMAVFFDLGAFISGNLVMLIEYFIKESPKDNNLSHSEQDKKQEREMAQIH